MTKFFVDIASPDMNLVDRLGDDYENLESVLRDARQLVVEVAQIEAKPNSSFQCSTTIRDAEGDPLKTMTLTESEVGS